MSEQFIEKAKQIHGDKYDYSKVKYITNLKEIIIICKEHGDFLQLPKTHKQGGGCKKCRLLICANKKILESKCKFFNEIKNKDIKNRWDYSKAECEFSGINNKITLKCNGCNNETTRTAWAHLNYFQPCKRKCYMINTIDIKLANINTINNIIKYEQLPEEWKIFPNNKNYLISNKGFIQNLKTKKIFNGSLDKNSGYMRTSINKKNYSIHYIVAITFLPNPENKLTVNHKNKNRTDNKLENLEWSTYMEQNIHKNINNTKIYKNHNNGKIILRIDKETNTIIEKYATIILASKWILENIYKSEINGKDIQKQLENMTSALSQKIKRNTNNWFGYNFIWKFEDIDANNEDNEIYKPIINIEKDGYYISNFGRIKNPSGKIKNIFSICGGYYDLKIDKNGKHYKIHRLVALHFIENLNNKPFINHKNGNKLDNRVENLEWCTNQENVIHGYETGLNKKGLSPIIQYDKDKNGIKEFKSISDASKELNINNSSISQCCRNIIKQTHGYIFKYKLINN